MAIRSNVRRGERRARSNMWRLRHVEGHAAQAKIKKSGALLAKPSFAIQHLTINTERRRTIRLSH